MRKNGDYIHEYDKYDYERDMRNAVPYHVAMRVGKIQRKKENFDVPVYIQYFRFESIIYAYSEASAISVAFTRSKEILKAGFEVELIFCEKVGNK